MRSADSATNAALVRAWRWALAPAQADPQRAEFTLGEFACEPGGDGDIVGAAFGKLAAEEAVVEAITPRALATMLEQRFWGSPAYGEHVGIDALWNALCSSVYLHRLRNLGVLYDAIEAGVAEGAFGHAADYDAAQQAYTELDYSRQVEDARRGLIVSPETARRQLAAEVTEPPVAPPPVTPPVTPPPGAYAPRRVAARKTLHGSISLDEVRAMEDEIVRNLSGEGVEITITIAIEARSAEGFSENTLRAVRENGEQLGVDVELPYRFEG